MSPGVLYFVLSPEICISTVADALYSSDIPFVGALCIK